MKTLNYDFKKVVEKRMLQLNELDEIRQDAYENSKLYKEKVKRWHDANLREKEFKRGDQVLLFNSSLRLFLKKLKSRWSGPFQVTKVHSYGAVEMMTSKWESLKVNGQRLKKYCGGNVNEFQHVVYLNKFVK